MALQGTINQRRFLGAAGFAAATAVVLSLTAFAPKAEAGQCTRPADLTGLDLPAGCLTPAEANAIRLRVFRAEMTVAALSCDQRPLYNTFVTRHQDELVKGGRRLRAAFERLHPGKGERELNRFITHLANRAAMHRLGIAGYCGSMAQVFERAIAVPRNGLLAFVQGGAMLATMETAAGETAAGPAVPATAQPVGVSATAAPTRVASTGSDE